MSLKFKDFYLNSLIKDPALDYVYDGSDKWYIEHTAMTTNGSLALGVTDEYSVINFRNFLDINILPTIFNNIKKYKDKEIVFITSNKEYENYTYESICKKFPNKTFTVQKASDNIQRDIRIVELKNKIAITVLESSKIFSIKYLIEYI